MRPHHSWLLTVVASLLMTSSTVMGGLPVHPVLVDGCPAGELPTECEKANEIPGPTTTPGSRQIVCKSGFVLESTIVGSPPDNLLEKNAQLKGACYSKCHAKFRKLRCPPGVPNCPQGEIPKYADPTISCTGSNKILVVNDKEIASSSIKCEKDVGWTDGANPIVNFANEGHSIEAFCALPPPPPTTPPTVCSGNLATLYVDDCPTASCPAPVFDGTNKLDCPQGSKMMIGSKLYDKATCDTATGWSVSTGVIFPSPTKIHASCHEFCSQGMVFDACPEGPIKCMKSPIVDASKKLSCPLNYLMIIDGKLYTDDVKCSETGWKAGAQPLIDYNTKPFEKIRAYCQPFSSMYEDNCVNGECNTLNFDPIKNELTCGTEDLLVVIDKNGDELVKTPAVATTTGWEITGPPLIKLIDYKNGIKKLKARCVSKCHSIFLDTNCKAPCTKPIYIKEGQQLLCRKADEELFLNNVKVPDVVCDAAAGGWKEAGKPALLVAFSSITGNKVKAVCKAKTVVPTPAPPAPTDSTTPPVTNGTESTIVPASSKQSSDSSMVVYILISLVIVLGLVVGGLGMFLWRLRKKQSYDVDEGHSKNKTKSTSKNNSSKKKNGKKGKKNSTKTSKKGKKGKKEKEKSKKEEKEKEEEVDNNVEVPEHQMSEANSTVPLTAALGGAGSPPTPNPIVMDV